ncbi:IS3 family transposase [Salmonella enterica subsp. enterica serovar Brancaster]|uniref:IS3 family transposase n=3 Tax=Salmonella enterica I TaxID=59201 RepID=A0A4V2HNA4_SALET|nr:IS3 family transposase [Salmonella enterica]EAA7876132.1 IS3 family transposase [Salmonella enterica subsp. enterica serovar Lexington]EBH9710006.1 IS3 family transposase [Salmonella enterica subsp. enterica serovar 4,[5],12:i:-]EBV5822420.1 IS3 family transposase [Salmonella enterica subsp. enterica serovar Cubana]ECG7022602.1 IS3 family transposase [Salmonella enterica subsp. enterica serovar Tamale]ECJ4470644.1 IS3 family transposase [Salmonella enterica subsp. enterica serovar Javiana]
MSGKRYPEEFKIEAVKQVVDRGYSVSSVATRLDITTHSLYAWIKKYGPDSSTNKEQSDAQAEILRLQKELKRVTDERDIFKKSRGVLRKAVRLRYAFIRDNTRCWPVRLLCRVLDVHPSGFYAWLQQPHSQREQANQMLTGQIKQFWLESGCVYGYRKIHLDLRDTGQQCGVNRVWRLMKRAGIKAQVGYRSPRARKGEDSIVAPDRLQRQFNPDAPDERWVTDITYIRTHEGWLYLAVVVDLFSRKVIGWSMQPRMTKEIVLNALLMALWRRNPQKAVLVHSDQGSQYTSYEWQSFLKSHGLEGSMSRRGNCHDNAVAESFFQLLKRERIKKKIYGTREEARSDIFDYIEMFYNSKRRHGSSDKMPPTEYENRYYRRLESV